MTQTSDNSILAYLSCLIVSLICPLFILFLRGYLFIIFEFFENEFDRFLLSWAPVQCTQCTVYTTVIAIDSR